MKGAKVLSSKEIMILLQDESQRDRILILVGLYFGTRISETVQLTFVDFKGQAMHVRSVKRSNDSHLIIPDEFRIELAKLKSFYLCRDCPISDSSPLFLSQKRDRAGNCKPISREHACEIIKALRNRYGLDERVSAHSLFK